MTTPITTPRRWTAVGHRDHFAGLHPQADAGGHRTQSGNTLRAAVLGANDGLVSNISLVMGMAGATTGDRAVLLAGLAGLVAGACSMALGEWLSVNSSREFYQAQITERAERLAVSPEDGRHHIAAIYRDKGLEPAAAEAMAGHLIETPRAALDLLVREDLGVDPGELGGSAWGAAISSFCLFACGAFFPVAPYLFLGGSTALVGSMLSTGLGLALIGVGHVAVHRSQHAVLGGTAIGDHRRGRRGHLRCGASAGCGDRLIRPAAPSPALRRLLCCPFRHLPDRPCPTCSSLPVT